MVPVQTLKNTDWTKDAINAFAPVCDVNPFGAIQSPGELVHGCYLFEYQHGKQAALVALQRDQFSGGCRVHVQAVQTLDPRQHLQTRQIMAAIEKTAFSMGADVLTMATQHKAIAAGASRWGGHISGVVLSKTLGASHGRII